MTQSGHPKKNSRIKQMQKKLYQESAEYLEMVGLSPLLYLNRMVDTCLSGGERKRIELASVLGEVRMIAGYQGEHRTRENIIMQSLGENILSYFFRYF